MLATSGELEEAIETLQRAAELEPDNCTILQNLGRALFDAGRQEEVLANYERWVDLDPESADAHLGLGNALCAEGRYDEAIESYRSLLERTPNVARVHFDLGCTYAAALRDEEAIESLRQALEIDPGLLDAHGWLAWLLATVEDVTLRDPGAALFHARWANDHIPAGADATRVAIIKTNLGAALYANREFDAAKEALEVAVEYGGTGEVMAQLFRALCHHRLGEDVEARRCFELADPGLGEELLDRSPELRRFVDEARAALASEGDG